MKHDCKDDSYFDDMTAGSIQGVAIALDRIAEMLKRLGNADAATHMGGLEALGLCITEAKPDFTDLGNSIIEASVNIEHGLMYLANVLKREESQ